MLILIMPYVHARLRQINIYVVNLRIFKVQLQMISWGVPVVIFANIN
jgi:hypothetical protein